MDQRALNLACQILDELRARNVQPTRLRVLADATNLGLSSEAAQDVADIVASQISGADHG
ncbi:hypothetical protein [Microvirga sp. P5_D2]